MMHIAPLHTKSQFQSHTKSSHLKECWPPNLSNFKYGRPTHECLSQPKPLWPPSQTVFIKVTPFDHHDFVCTCMLSSIGLKMFAVPTDNKNLFSWMLPSRCHWQIKPQVAKRSSSNGRRRQRGVSFFCLFYPSAAKLQDSHSPMKSQVSESSAGIY